MEKGQTRADAMREAVEGLLEVARQSGAMICGIDEVGRGALCGPVMTACVGFVPGPAGAALAAAARDSKALSPRRREEFAAAMGSGALVALGAASAGEISVLGIRPATLLAMARAAHRFLGLCPRPVAVVVDGVDALPGFAPVGGESRLFRPVALPAAIRGDLFRPPGGAVVGCLPLIKGDALIAEISAASIAAKVARDRLMARLAVRCPGYGWERNAGYGTAAHAAGLRDLGPSRHHRLGFALPGWDGAMAADIALLGRRG